MNKTIYIRDEDASMWDRAKELAGDKLSPVIVDSLKRFVADREARSKGFERIEVRYNDADNHGIPAAKAFYGRWIFSPKDPVQVCGDGENYCRNYAVAITTKGAAVVYSWYEHEADTAVWNQRFLVFSSLEEAARDLRVSYAACQAISRVGVPVEELDI